MAFDLPRDTVFPVDEVDVRLVPGCHPFEIGREAEIAAQWRRERAAKPALHDGEVILLSALAYSGRKLVGRCHMVRYSTFLTWRATRAAIAEHAYAHAVLAARDGALVAIRMGAHTVNAGRVYFASGSFEPADFRDGHIDLHANMVRELREETGLELDEARPEPGFHAFSIPAGTVIFRRYVMPEDANTLAAEIRAHVAGDPDPEIEGPVIIRSADELPEGLMPHMPALIRWHFATWTPAGKEGASRGESE